MNFQDLPASGNSVVPGNENLETIEFASVYGKRHPVTTALTWGYYGGRWGGFAITAGTLTLTNAATNYIVVAIGTGVISVSTSATNWNDTTNYARVYKLTTAGSVVTATEDHRAGASGIHGSLGSGGAGIPLTIIDAKGDLIAGTAADTASRLAVGTNTHVLTADSGEATGLKWAAPGATTFVPPRVGTTASSATPTPDADAHDVYTVTAMAEAATFGAPTGSPVQAQPLLLRIKDDGTARTLSFNAIYRAIGVTLPTTTVASGSPAVSKTLYLGMFYNATESVWDVISVLQET